MKIQEKVMNLHLLNPENYLIFLFAGTFLITMLLLPRIRFICIKYNLMDVPVERSSHTNVVPSFGGVSFYITLIFTLFTMQQLDANGVIITLIAAISVMFFTGLKDDLRNISPRNKMIGQFVSVSLIMLHDEFRISNLHGFLGIYEIHPIIAVLLSVFLLIGLINAYNLIDGIDGMASVTGIVVATSFGLLFYKLGLYFYLSIATSIVSTLFAFLRFNFSNKRKIFMGDTGSLLIGLVLGILMLKLLTINYETMATIAISRTAIPLLVLGILIIPAFDISRVIFIRLTKRVPVFSPDRNHIHHLLIDAGLTHKLASITVGIINSIIIAILYYSIQNWGLGVGVLIFLFLIFVLILTFFIINKRYETKKIKVKIRNLLFTIFILKLNKSNLEEESIRKIVFNQKLRAIRIFFF